MNVFKIIRWSYVQNMIENMILTSYLDKSYFVASRGGCLMGYVASIQTMLCDKLKHQVGHEFFFMKQVCLYIARQNFMLHCRLCNTMARKQVDAGKDAFYLCCTFFCCIRTMYYKNTYS